MTTNQFKNFSEFWPFYLREHSHPLNRRFHFVGTLIVHLLALYILVSQTWWFFLILPICGYSFAWIGHFVIEKNRPATFTYPWWSLRGDFKTFYLMLARKL
ncbi:MAG TPA: DUF962 domain-containing protein [Bdellovibrio sp.]|nr:DUF962 domain-containing protein [Bdellovibrio sp.]